MLKIRGITGAVVLAASIATLGTSPASAQHEDWKRSLVFGGGSLGGVYYTVAGAISDMLQRELDGIDRVSAVTGSTTLFIPQIQDGRVDLMLGTPDSLYFGWSDEAGQGFDAGEVHDKLRVGAVTYVNIMNLVVLNDSGIESVADIGNGRVAVLSATLLEPMEHYLRAHGIDNPQVSIIGDWNQMGQALRDRSIAAMQAIATHPMPAVTELGNAVSLRLLPYGSDEAIDEFLSHPTTRFFQRTTQPAGTYDWQTEDYATVGRGTTLVISADLPEDQVYEMIRTIYVFNPG